MVRNLQPCFLLLRFLKWLGTYNYESLKEEQMEISKNEHLLMKELRLHRLEIEKQKKRMKSMILLLEEQYQTTNQIAEDLHIEEDEE